MPKQPTSEAVLAASHAVFLGQEPFEAHLKRAGFTITPFEPFPPAPPLCFVHVPKTAGASLIAALDCMFDVEDILHAYNPDDFTVAAPEGLHFFRGHMLSAFRAKLPPETQMLTVLRDPIALARSMYDHLRRVQPQDWDLQRETAEQNLLVTGADPTVREQAESAGAVCRRLPLESVLLREEPAILAHFIGIMVRYLGASQEAHDVIINSPVPAARSAALESALTEAKAALCRFNFVAMPDQLDLLVQRLCLLRGWPLPPRLPRIHDFAAEKTEVSAEAAALLRARAPQEFALYDFAQTLFLRGSAGLHDPNGAFVRRFRQERPPTLGFDLTAQQAWPGSGFGLRRRNAQGLYTRGIEEGGQAFVVARLRGGFRYALRLELADIASPDLLARLLVSVDGCRLPICAGPGWLPDGGMQVGWLLDAPFDADGCVRVDLRWPEPIKEDAMLIRRISCLPVLTA